MQHAAQGDVFVDGIVCHVTSDRFFSFFTAPDVISSYGDPIDFVTGGTHGDPL